MLVRRAHSPDDSNESSTDLLPSNSDMNIHRHLQNNVPIGWEAEFGDSDEGILEVCEKLEELDIVLAPRCDLTFRAYELVPKNKVKVVIIGEGPYHTPNVANGLSFSCNGPVAPSLKNIYKELERSIPDFRVPTHGDLTSWCSEGVLLLNTSLTVKLGSAGFLPRLWMSLIDSTVNGLINRDRHIIWMLWGEKAKIVARLIGDKGIVLTAAHPSPLNTRGGFVGCGHFSKCNAILTSKGRTAINWSLPGPYADGKK